jgi:hypothetical protein
MEKEKLNKKKPIYWKDRLCKSVNWDSMNLGGKIKVKIDKSFIEVNVDELTNSKSNKAIKNIIVLTLENGKKETWGSLSEICQFKGFSSSTLYKKDFPFEMNGIKFEKIPFREEYKP